MITALYAGLLTPIFVFLGINVIRARRKNLVPVGDGGNTLLLRRMRVQANFAEYVPLALILMVLIELMKGSHILLHVMGVVLFVGRLSHAYGMSQVRENFVFRVSGMAATLSVLLIGAGSCIILALMRGVFSAL